jgi:nitrate/nitrite-specific signal transduction histidine kinase
MAGDPKDVSRVDLLAQQAAFFESYFRKGAEFTRELMEETQRLRMRLAELEQRLEGDGSDRELEERYLQIERENNDLAALYVAQSQLHSTLDVGEVLQVLVEVLLNFVGAERFAILADDAGRLRTIATHGLDESEVPAGGFDAARFETVIAEGGVHGDGVERREIGQEPTIAIALLGRGRRPLGVIAIWGFLRQKKELATVDGQIFDLLATSGGLALEAARVATEARRRMVVTEDRSAFASFHELLEEQ